MKNTVSTFINMKRAGEKISMLTAYDYSAAKLIDSCNINGILVGDSLGMVCLGYKDTLAVTMEDMIHHTKAVSRGVESSLVVGDMPFMSYTNVKDAVKNAGRLIKEGGATAVKLEGGAKVSEQIKAIVDAQIPVMGHIGLTPQSVNVFGGFKVQGKTAEGARQIIEDAKILEASGVFAIVLECVPSELAKIISDEVRVPTIGIGAGVNCDGQILVYQDMISMFSGFKPKFVKEYANVGAMMREAFISFDMEVKGGEFPEKCHSFKIEEHELERLY